VRATSVGHPIAAAALGALDDDQATELLRRKTYWLAHRKPHQAPKLRRIEPRNEAPLCEAIPPEWILGEFAALPKERLLVESGDWQGWLADRDRCPFAIREIGRLRH